MANRHRGRTSAGVMESDAYSGRAVRYVCDTPTERLRKEREGETGKHLSSKDPGRPLVPKRQTAGVTTRHPGETARSRSCRPFRACFHPRKKAGRHPTAQTASGDMCGAPSMGQVPSGLAPSRGLFSRNVTELFWCKRGRRK